jgi:putative methylase
MQKRLARKLDLEVMLSNIPPHPAPTPDLEQYTISADVAATMLYIAAYSNEDIVDKTVIDLGCGTGRLAIGAAFLGAKEAVGLDVDKTAVKLALENSAKTGLKEKTQWVLADIDSVHGSFDTVLQNPPFGVQRRGADRKFIVKALELGKVVYSLHKRPSKDSKLIKRLKKSSEGTVAVPPSPFMKKFIEQSGGRIEAVYALLMRIPHMFSFHTEKKHEFVVDLYIMRRKSPLKEGGICGNVAR